MLQNTNGRQRTVFRNWFSPSIMGLGWRCSQLVLYMLSHLAIPETIRFKRIGLLSKSEDSRPVAFGLWLMESIATDESVQWINDKTGSYTPLQGHLSMTRPGSEGL